MTTTGEARSRLPRGWFATLVGGVLGTVGGGIAGAGIGSAYADANADRYEGLAGLGPLIYGILGGAWVGAAIGAAALLMLLKHHRPLASGFAFAACAVLLMTILTAFGQMLLPHALQDTVGAFLLFVLTPVVSAIIVRSFFQGDPRVREEASS